MTERSRCKGKQVGFIWQCCVCVWTTATHITDPSLAEHLIILSECEYGILLKINFKSTKKENEDEEEETPIAKGLKHRTGTQTSKG